MTVRNAGARPSRPWRIAMADALTGTYGFYRVPGAPRSHFSTPVTAGPAYAALVARLLVDVDAALGHPRTVDLVDVGSADGTLARAVVGALGRNGRADLLGRLRCTDVDLPPRGRPLPRSVTGLLVATEWLDTVPVDVVVRDGSGELRVVTVDEDGRQGLGPPPGPGDRAWLERWWPVGEEPGSVAEVGRLRDEAWARVVDRLVAGAALATDYGHVATARPAGSTLAGWRLGRQVPPVPDGTCDVTASVAMDSCAAAACAAWATGDAVTGAAVTGDALAPLAEIAGRLVPSTPPHPSLAATDPVGYLTELSAHGDRALLTDSSAFGSYLTVLQWRMR